MPPRRDYKGAYARRNERARALGYESYYDYRAHDNGRIPPAAARLAGPALARARGHRSAADLLRTAKPGDLIVIDHGRERDSRGRYKKITVRLIGDDGKETDFELKGGNATARRLRRIEADLRKKDVAVRLAVES